MESCRAVAIFDGGEGPWSLAGFRHSIQILLIAHYREHALTRRISSLRGYSMSLVVNLGLIDTILILRLDSPHLAETIHIPTGV